MDKTKASFRALREACGYTQQDIADEFDVDIRSVKRWERPNGSYAPPEDVFCWLEHELSRMMLLAAKMAESSLEIGDGEISIAYYRTQDDLDSYQLDAGVDEAVGFVNAASRYAAMIIMSAGRDVTFRYMHS